MQSLKNGTQLGPYTLTRLIGRGGMGEVYEALENKLQRQVALKVIAPMNPEEHDYDELIRRFIFEARTLAKINHPNIVTVYGIDKVNDVQFIAMEFVDGASFKEILQKQKLTADQAAPLFEQMVDGLRCLHENKILHRDLKPHNILLRVDGKIKILDFGIAKNLSGDVADHTVVGLIVGTIPYMAPEVQAGVPASPRSDYWSLGAIFYECLVGTPLAVVLRESKNPKEVPFSENAIHSIPSEMRAIICRMLAFKPSDRYESADQIIDDLKRFRQNRSPLTSVEMQSLMEQVEKIVHARRRGEIWKAPLKAIRNAFASSSDTDASKTEEIPPPPPLHPSERARTATSLHRDHLSTGIDPYGRSRITQQRRKKSRRKKSTDSYLFPVFITLVALIIAFMLSRPNQVEHRRAEVPAPAEAPAPLTLPSIERAEVVPSPFVELSKPYDRETLWLEPNRLPTLSWSRALAPGEYEIQIATDENFRNLVIREAVSGSFYRPAEVLPEGVYHWRLFPKLSGRNILMSHSFTWALLSPLRLNRPGADEVIDINARFRDFAVSFDWTCKVGAVDYRIQISNRRDFRRLTHEQVTKDCQWQTSLAKGIYFWRVKIDNPPAVAAIWSEIRTLKLRPEAAVQPLVTAPPPKKRSFELEEPKILRKSTTFILKLKGRPRDLASLGSIAANRPVLQWQPVKDARSYQVQISTVETFEHLLSEETATTNQLEWKSPSPGSFFWRVRAQAPGREPSSFSSHGVLQVYLPGPQLRPNYKFQVPRIEPQPVELSWKKVPLAHEYLIQFSQDRRLQRASEQVSPEPKILFEPTPAAYFIRVAALDDKGVRISEFSSVAALNIEASNAALAKPVLERPSLGARAPSRAGKISISFAWTEVAGADAYVLELSGDPTFKSVIEQARFTEPKGILKQVELKGRVYWRVRAQSSQGISDWSDPLYFEVLN